MKRRYFRILLVVATWCVAGFLILEIGLRVVVDSYADLTFWAPDPITGWKGFPNAQGRSEESNLRTRLNSQGMHDREHSLEKAPNIVRIAVLGDSMTEGIEVLVDETFSSVTEQELAACRRFAGRRVEVLNFGVRGYGTAQEILALRDRVWAYSPDIIVLAFFSGNDITDNSPIVAPDHRPYLVREGGKLVPNYFYCAGNMSVARLRFWARAHSRVLQLAAGAYSVLRARLRGSDRWAAVDNMGVDSHVYLAPRDLDWEGAWQLTEAQIVLMRDEVAGRGAKFLLVTLDNPLQVYPDPSTRRQYMQHLGIENLLYPEARLRTMAQREGIPVLNLAPLLQAYADEHRTFLHGFGNHPGRGHWNREGHHVAGELIAKKICSDTLAVPVPSANGLEAQHVQSR